MFEDDPELNYVENVCRLCLKVRLRKPTRLNELYQFCLDLPKKRKEKKEIMCIMCNFHEDFTKYRKSTLNSDFSLSDIVVWSFHSGETLFKFMIESPLLIKVHWCL